MGSTRHIVAGASDVCEMPCSCRYIELPLFPNDVQDKRLNTTNTTTLSK